MSEALKKTTGKALFWSFIDKGGQQVIQLVFGYILARLLVPEEFGLVAVLAIFTAVANLLQDSGFSSAIIRSQNPDPRDFSSVFYLNISIGLVAYCCLFVAAPHIAAFYDKPLLTNLSRVIFLAFVFNAFAIIQNVNLIRKMDFKTNTRITLIAGSASGLVAIALAYMGYGVWALAGQIVMQSFVRSLLLWIFVRWTPSGGFSAKHIKAMSAYSIKLLATAILNQICANVYTIIIGKRFSISQSGIYSQATKLSAIPQSVISDGIKNVAFPVLSQVGDDGERQKRAFRKIVRISAFISFPVALMLIVMARPIVVIYLSDKWVDVIPILQLLAVGGAFYPLYCLVQALLQSIGKSGKILGIESFRNLLSIVIIVISIQFGVKGLAAGLSIANITAFAVAALLAGKYISYTLSEIIKDILPYLAISILSFAPTYFIGYVIDNIYLLFAIQLFCGSLLYLAVVKISGSVILQESIVFFKQFIKKQ